MKMVQWFWEKILALFRRAQQQQNEVAAATSRRPFIGRTHELAKIESLWRDVSHGHGQLLAITGKAGVGKKTLVRHFLNQKLAATPEPQFAAVDCRADWPSLAPIWELLPRLSITITDDFGDKWLLFRHDHLLNSLSQEIVAAYHTELSQESTAIAPQLYQAIFQALVKAGKRRQLLIVIDNCQDCDAATIAFLTFLAQHLQEFPGLVMLLGQERGAAVDAVIAEGCPYLELAPLSREEMAAYLSARFGCHQFDTAGDRIYQLSQGLPLILQELSDLFLDLGVIAPLQGKWTLTHPDFTWPQDYPDIVRQRMRFWKSRTTSQPDQAMLLAALQGIRFRVAVWSSYFAADDFIAIVAAFADAARNYRIIHLAMEAIGHENPAAQASYRFLHQLYPEMIIGSASKKQCQELHLVLAQLLEKSEALPAAALSAQLLFHFSQAQKHGSSAGYCYRLARYEMAWQHWQVAGDYCELGLENLARCREPGQQERLIEIDLLRLQGFCLMRLQQLDQARLLFQQALEKARPFPQAMVEAIYWLGKTEKQLGLFAQAQQTLQRSLHLKTSDSRWRAYLLIELADSLAGQQQWGQLDSTLAQLSSGKKCLHLDPKLAWIILIKQGHWREQEMKWSLALQFYRQAVDKASELGDKSAIAISAYYLGGLLQKQESWCKSIEQYRQSWPYLQRRQSVAISCRTTIGVMSVIIGKASKGWQWLQQAHQLAGQSEDALARLTVLQAMGDVAAYCCQWRQAQEYYQQALALCEADSEQQRLAMAFEKLAMAQLELAEWEQCLQKLQQALTLRAKAGAGSQAPTFYLLGYYHRQRYEYNEAMDYYQQSISAAKKTGDQPLQARTLDEISRIQLAVDKWQDALATLQRSLKIKEKLEINAGRGVTLGLLGDVHCQQRNFSKARQYYNSSQQISEASGDTAASASLLEKLGRFYLSQGKSQKAIDKWKEALELRRQIEDNSGGARLYAHIAKAYRQLLRHDQALDQLELALTLLEKQPGDRELSYVFNLLGNIQLEQQDLSRALGYYQRGLAIAERVYDRYHQGKILNNIAEIALRRQQLLLAMENFSQALVINERIENSEAMSRSYEGIARTYTQFNRLDKAIDNYKNALGCGNKSDNSFRIAEIQKQLEVFALKKAGFKRPASTISMR